MVSIRLHRNKKCGTEDFRMRQSGICISLCMISRGFGKAARIRKYGPENVGKRKSSIGIALHMVFRRVREGGQKHEIWSGRCREAKIIDLHMFRYGFS